MERSTQVEVLAPADRLWAVVQDVDRWPALVQTVTAVERLDSGPLGVGSRARITQPRLPTSEYVVTAHEPGRSFTWETTSPGVRVTALHEVVPVDATACRLRLVVRQTGVVGVLSGPFLRGLTDRYLAAEAAALKAAAEGTT
ncbi:hypothetical protein GCM10028777_19660 [Angustibacter speluncae]